MRKMVSKILRQYGTEILLDRDGEPFRVRGFFQPVRSKSWYSLVSPPSSPEEEPRRQYIYIGPADVQAAEGDILTVDGKRYFLRRVEIYHYGDEAVYTWGMCIDHEAQA